MRRVIAARSSAGLGWSGGLAEEAAHGLGACFHDGAELLAVDQLGGAGGCVSTESGDFLDRDAGVGHEVDEGVNRAAVSGASGNAVAIQCAAARGGPSAGDAGGFDHACDFDAYRLPGWSKSAGMRGCGVAVGGGDGGGV